MVNKFEFWCTPAKENRRIHLYLPDDYDRTQERYPVLYMFDGHNLFFDEDATYGTCLGMREFLDGWYKKLIVVGITCSDRDLQRVHEYCPYHIYSNLYGEIRGRGDATMRWIADELKPFIDRTYRTYPHREATAIAGYSMGGMMSLYAVLRYNAVFSKAAVISPAFLPAMAHFREEIQTHSYSSDTRIFFSWGTAEDAPSAVEQLASSIRSLEWQVQQKGVQTYLHCQTNGQHNEGSWRWQLPVWMRFLWF